MCFSLLFFLFFPKHEPQKQREKGTIWFLVRNLKSFYLNPPHLREENHLQEIWLFPRPVFEPTDY